MSAKTLSKIKEELLEAGIEATWTQWSALGAGTIQSHGTTQTQSSASTIVDPEALLLFSLYLIPEEQRLRDLVRWWAEVGSELLSVQRAKTLLDEFPSEVRGRIKTYSRWAVESGDKRWRRYADEGDNYDFNRDRKGPENPDLGSPASLLYRLRAGFGVGAKADVLAYLLGIEERSVTTKETVGATSYSRATVGGALEDLSRASFIESTGTHPKEYFAPLGPWEKLILRGHRNSSFPGWRHWGQVYAFLARSRKWIEEAENQSEYMMSTRARDVFEDFRRTFEVNRIQVPSPEDYQGATYVEGFVQTVARLSEWTKGNV